MGYFISSFLGFLAAMTGMVAGMWIAHRRNWGEGTSIVASMISGIVVVTLSVLVMAVI